MELVKLGDKTYYIKNATNIGVYKVSENEVYLIDTGNDKDAGKKILKIIEEMGWSVKGLINTHSNADHIGGNKVIQDRTGADIYAKGMEKCFAQYPILEASLLYGAYPFGELRNKFLMAKESCVQDIDGLEVSGLEFISLKGHFLDMIGIKTSDDVYFLGDALFSEETILKYHLFFIYDVREFLNTLDYLDTLKASYFVASHVEVLDDISSLVQINRKKVQEIIGVIKDFCATPIGFEDLLKKIFDKYNLVMNVNQYVLVGSTVRSYLSYMNDEKILQYHIKDNKVLWYLGELIV